MRTRWKKLYLQGDRKRHRKEIQKTVVQKRALIQESRKLTNAT